MENEIITTEWYNALIEECGAIISETIFKSRWDLIEGYHLLGKRILEEYDNFERNKIYGNEIVQRIAKSLGKSRRVIYYAIQFARKYDDLSTLPEGKNISWHKVCTKILPKGEEKDLACKHEEFIMVKVCKVCHHRMEEE